MNKFDKGKLTQSILLIEIYLKALLFSQFGLISFVEFEKFG